MDEPFGNVDVQLKLQLQRELMDLWESERKTVVFVTHDLEEAIALSDRVIVLVAPAGADQGRYTDQLEAAARPGADPLRARFPGNSQATVVADRYRGGIDGKNG